MSTTQIDPREILASIDPDEVKDLLEEVGDMNYVRVVKHEARRVNRSNALDPKFQFKSHVVDEGNAGIKAALGSLLKIDSLRVAKGKKPVFLDAALSRSGGKLVSVSFNLRTNAGIDFAADALGTTGTQPLTATYLALSNNNVGASATHASSTVPWSSNQSADAASSGTTGETNFGGLARAAATYAHTTTVTNYTQTKTWTASATATTLQLAGMFGGANRATLGSSATNILFVENTFTSTSLVTNDQLTLTWTINI